MPDQDEDATPATSGTAVPADATEDAEHDGSPEAHGSITVAVFGAGIAGLTAAHELVERGFKVTVYEQQYDERPRAVFADGVKPAVKLGGLAASHWARPADGDDDHNEIDDQVFRLFPGSTEPGAALPDFLPGEHGFRFFPAYYLHTWDTMQRIPQYEARTDRNGGTAYVATNTTVYDNVERVITQGMTTEPGASNVIFSRVPPQTLAEAVTAASQLGALGFEPSDLAAFSGRMSRYQAMGVERRRREMQHMSAYDFFVDRDPDTFQARITYSDAFDSQIRDMPKVLAAFDSVYGDARTNLDTYLQLQLDMHRANDKADGVLNGPTTEAWFDHWYHHLRALGVEFECAKLCPFELDEDGKLQATVESIEEPIGEDDAETGPRGRARSGTKQQVDADYFVVATDAVTAERACEKLQGKVFGTVSKLAGYTSSRPTETEPSRWPGVPTRPHRDEVGERNPYKIAEIGTEPWDRFQTLSGIQYYFVTEFQLVRGHVYFTGSEWGLSSINQSGLWRDQPSINHRVHASKWLQGYATVLSVDIGDWHRPSSHTGKAAIESTDDEIAAEVWRQMTSALLATGTTEDTTFPRPTWYTLDRNLLADSQGLIEENLAPYLVPIVNDWESRPGGPPWNPHGSSYSFPPTAEQRSKMADERYWEAAHGGYQVHCDSLVFAGTWAKTFTRMTSMESANESARHAVNAILDHFVHDLTGDERKVTGLQWMVPFGFLDQRGSGPVRQPTPAGDYCFIYDLENLEPADYRPTRLIDDELAAQGRPHPWESLGIDALIRGGPQLRHPLDSLPSFDRLMDDLRQWNDYLETMLPGAGSGAGAGNGAGTRSPNGAVNGNGVGTEIEDDGREVEPPRLGGGFSRRTGPDDAGVGGHFRPGHDRLAERPRRVPR